MRTIDAEELRLMREELKLTEVEIAAIDKIVQALTLGVVKSELDGNRMTVLAFNLDLRLNERLWKRDVYPDLDIDGIIAEFAVDRETAGMIAVSVSASTDVLVGMTVENIISRQEGSKIARLFTVEVKTIFADTIGEVMGNA